MLTCGTVILDISNSNDEVILVSDYLKLLKDLLEKEEANERYQSATSDDGDILDSRKRYLILISTVMTWALTKPLDPQKTYELMTLHLNMEPTFIVETMGLQWTSELSFAENIPTLMKQFKKERGLKPFKELRVSHWKEGETAALKAPSIEDGDNVFEDEDDLEDDEAEREAARVTIAMLRSGRSLSEEEIIGYIRKKLLSHEAENKGWVLDGFPNNLAQCSTLFEKGEEQDNEGSDIMDTDYFDEDADLYSNVLRKLLPDIVVSLEVTDEFICEKAMRQPEDESHLDEEIVLKRLNEFRAADAPDVTPLNFFDELDIHPLVVAVNDHKDYSMRGPYAEVSLRMGRPCRYGKLIEIIEEAEKKEKAERKLMEAKQEKALEEMKAKMKEEYEEEMEYWSELYALMREEEELCLAAAGEPMRNYLVQYIFPTLTAGLLEVAKLRPDDPIDFLAEYLFKLNPTGKMLEPGYNLKAEKLLGKIKMLDEAWKDLDIKIEPLLPPDDDFDADGASTSKKKLTA
ncbi:unnamed protein product, partial [Iphiclides podalirius]